MEKDTITYDQAMEELNQLLNNAEHIRVADVESIISRISIIDTESSTGAVSYLYSGWIGGDTANALAVEIAMQQGSMARIIDHTPAAKFLQSDEYTIALKLALQNENPALKSDSTLLKTAVTDYMKDSEAGPWVITSRRFAEATVGDLICFVAKAEPDRIWWLAEMPAVLKNRAITSINGIDKPSILLYMDHLKNGKGFSESQAVSAVNELIVAKSYLDICKIYQYIDESGTMHMDFSAVNGAENPNIPKGATLISYTDYVKHVKSGDMAALEAFEKYGEINPSSKIKDARQWSEFVSRFSKENAKTEFPNLYKLAYQNKFAETMGTLGKIGKAVAPVFIAISAVTALQEAQKMYEETGDITESVKLCTEWALELKGGMAAAGLAMEACMPLAMALSALGPWGVFGAVVLELGAGAAGFAIGSNLGQMINDAVWMLGEGISNVILDFMGVLRARQMGPQVRIDPLILDLNQDGIFSDQLNENMYFDFGGDGFSENTGWAASGDGFLVRDINQNGVIDNGTELFGDRTLLTDGTIATGGFQALTDLDSNKDGRFNEQDSAFGELKVWVDRNSDGISQGDELFTLDSLHITEFDLNARISNRIENGNVITRLGTYTTSDGVLHLLGELNFNLNPMDTRLKEEVEADAEIKATLPDLKASGTMLSLHQAMTLDAGLKELATQFLSCKDAGSRRELLESLVKRWAGCQNVDPASRGGIMDASKLAVIEQFFGTAYQGAGGSNLNIKAAAILKRVYDDLLSDIYNRLLVQTQLIPFIAMSCSKEEAGGNIALDYTLCKAAFELYGKENLLNAQDLLGEYVRFLKNAKQYKASFSLEEMKNAFADSEILSMGILLGAADNKFYGFSGNDTLTGTNGSDILYGGAGNDTLSGNAGIDILYGEAGNDTLHGGDGNDIYVFGIGDGTDTILDYSGVNTILFLEGITADDLVVSWTSYHDVTLSVRGCEDKLVLSSFRNNPIYRNFIFAFADGTKMQVSDADSPFRKMLGTEAGESLSVVYGSDSVLHGFGGNDILTGAGGSDILHGGSGDDIQKGGTGNDTLYGEAGNDTLYGEAGDDILYGGVGNDALNGGDGDDTYVFGLGDGCDTIKDTSGVNKILFREGIQAEDLTVTWTGSKDVTLSVKGGGDKLVLYYFRYNDTYRNYTFVFADGTAMRADDPDSPFRKILGTETGENLSALYETDSVLNGLGGNDTLTGAGGSDTLYGGNGDDSLYGRIGHDTLYGEAGNDTLYGDAGDDTLYGGLGNDTLNGGYGDDTYIFGLGDGCDTLSDCSGVNTIRFLEGIRAEDLLVSWTGSSDVTLSVKGGMDKVVLSYFRNNDTYRNYIFAFADGTKMRAGDADSPFRALLGTETGENLSAVYGSDSVLHGFGGNDTLSGGSGNDILYGGEGIDSLNGKAGNDTLYGDAGNDTLYGDAGDDILYGGTGNDMLNGGYGDDTYVFGLGDGTDTISDHSGVNTIRFPEGMKADDLLVSWTGSSDVTLSVKGSQDKVVLSNFRSNPSYRSYTFRFAGDTKNYVIDNTFHNFIEDSIQQDDTYVFGLGDGVKTISDKAGINTINLQEGIKAEDLIVSWTGTFDVTLSVKGYKDKLILSEFRNSPSYQNYIFQFADGTRIKADDADSPFRTMIGSENGENMNAHYTADTVLHGFGGNDTLSGSDGNDTLYGGIGNDSLNGRSGDDTLYGESGNDTLNGESGNDILYGGIGNDSLNGGDGDDLYVFGAGDGIDTVIDSAGSNTVRFGEGIQADDLLVSFTGSYDVTLSVKGCEDKLVLSDFRNSPSYQNYTFAFADGTIIKAGDADSPFRTILGTQDGETMNAHYGSDTVMHGFGGIDMLFGSAGNDTLYGGFGNDTLSGGSGNDILYGESGNDTLNGDTGNDFLSGGGGDDFLNGGAGDDTYYFGLGDGVDKVIDSAGTNIIRFGEGIQMSDLSVLWTASSNDVTLSVKGCEDKLVLSDFKNNPTCQNYIFEFADGTKLHAGDAGSPLRDLSGTQDGESLEVFYDLDTILHGFGGSDYLTASIRNDTLYGGYGDDTLYGRSGDDVLYGESGNDVLYGEAGDDYLSGGSGNDTLNGGEGDDTYFFGLGDEIDTVIDLAGNNIIRFREGIQADDLTVLWTDTNDATLSVKGTGDKLVLSDYRSSPSYRNFLFEFADGTIMNTEELKALPETEAKDTVKTMNSGDSVLHGFGGNDILYGAGENDTLYGEAGNDSLYGRSGNDILYGQTGNDTLYGEAGDDTLYGGQGNDTLSGGDGNDTYVFGLGDGCDIISDGSGINTIKFREGIKAEDLEASWTDPYHASLSVKGCENKIVLSNFKNNPSYRNYTFEFADGTRMQAGDTDSPLRNIYGTEAGERMAAFYESDSVLHGLGGSDTMYGTEGNETLYGGTGNDLLYGRNGNDTLYGESGNDTINGEAGDDTLYGGAGNDSLNGGDGNDTYVFGIGDGIDTVLDYSGVNTIRFLEGITADDLVVSWTSYHDVTLSVRGCEDKLVLSSFRNNPIYRNFIFAFADGTKMQVSDADSPFRKMLGTEAGESLSAVYGSDSVLHGFGGNDILTGAGGSDSLYGGGGNNTLNGKAGNDTLYGESGNDTLNGEAGDDTLYGGAGNDILNGGAGNDTYLITSQNGADTIIDAEGNDTLLFETHAQNLIFSRSSKNLLITILGTDDSVTVNNWYSGTDNRIETITSGDGYYISQSQIELLIQSMASFETSTGMSWTQAVQNEDEAIKDINSQIWVRQAG